MSVAAAAIIAAGSVASGALVSSASGSSSVPNPGTPDIGATAGATLASEQATAPGQLALAQQYGPAYQDILNNLQAQGLFGSANSPGQIATLQQSAPELQALQSSLNQQQAGSNIGLVNQYGLAATQAFQNANPQLQQIQSGITGLATNGQNPVSMPGYSNSTIDQLNNTAQQQLALGSSISPQQASTLSGQILANYNAQGRANDPTAIAGLATGLDTYGQQLLTQREQNAASAGSLQAQSNAALTQQSQGAQLSNAQYNLGALQGAGSLLSQTSVNPFAAILGQSGAIGTSSNASTASGATGQLNNAESQFNPYPISAGLENTYLNNTSAGSIATANNNQSTQMGILNGLFGTGSFICWVARACYGPENPKWMLFRHWLLEYSPRWFRALYIRHGEAFALWIQDKPRVKNLIRSWMDSRIATLENC